MVSDRRAHSAPAAAKVATARRRAVWREYSPGHRGDDHRAIHRWVDPGSGVGADRQSYPCCSGGVVWPGSVAAPVIPRGVGPALPPIGVPRRVAAVPASAAVRRHRFVPVPARALLAARPSPAAAVPGGSGRAVMPGRRLPLQQPRTA